MTMAKFLRAYYHFELFRHFGPIPVVTEPLDPSDVNLERNTMSEVMSQVVKDCQEAAELLPTIAAAVKSQSAMLSTTIMKSKTFQASSRYMTSPNAEILKTASMMKITVHT